VQVLVLPPPLVERDPDAFGSALVQQFPPEIVDDEPSFGRKEIHNLVESGAEIGDVMKGTLRDNRVEGLRRVDVLDLRAAKERAFRSVWVDGEDVVAGVGERGRELARSAAHFKHARAARRQLPEYECGHIHEFRARIDPLARRVWRMS
jgi:hypothetical protein